MATDALPTMQPAGSASSFQIRLNEVSMLISAISTSNPAVVIGHQGGFLSRASLVAKETVGPIGGWTDAATAIRELERLTAGDEPAAVLVRDGARLVARTVYRSPGAFERLGSVLTGTPIRLSPFHAETDEAIRLSSEVVALIDGSVHASPAR
jgi:hypothetical protein